MLKHFASTLCLVVVLSQVVDETRWVEIDRIRDTVDGQPSYTFAQSVDKFDNYLIFGSPTSNMAKGNAKVYLNVKGRGYQVIDRLVDPNGITLDAFGSVVAFNVNVSDIVVGSPQKHDGRGGVFVFARTTAQERLGPTAGWGYSQELQLLTADLEIVQFGRRVAIDGDYIVASAQSRRPGFTATNVRGTRHFMETTDDDLVPADPVFIFLRKNDTTWLQLQKLYQVASDPVNVRFGESLDMWHDDNGPKNADWLVVGAAPLNFDLIDDVNNTLYLGEICVYRQKDDALEWELFQNFRPTEGNFIGHSVSMHNNRIAFGNWHPGLNITGVFVYSMNDSGLYSEQAYIPAPYQDDALFFGQTVSLYNSTLVVGSPNLYSRDVLKVNGTSGAVYVYQDVTGSGDWVLSQRLQDDRNFMQDTDNFGLGVALYQSEVAILSTFTDPDELLTNYRLSAGEATVWRNQLNISAPESMVVCQYTNLTANVTSICRITARDAKNQIAGGERDSSDFTVEVTGALSAVVQAVSFVEAGIFRFGFRPQNTGSGLLTVLFNGVPLSGSPVAIVVSTAIEPTSSSVSCPSSVSAGFPVRCSVITKGSGGVAAGEQNSAAVMTAAISNVEMNDLFPGEILAARGQCDNPVPTALMHSPLRFVSTGLFEFEFTPRAYGAHSVLVSYAQQPVDPLSLVIVDATLPAINASLSSWSCVSPVAPGRNNSCIITVRGGGVGALTSTVDDLSQFAVELKYTNVSSGVLTIGSTVPNVTLAFVSIGIIRVTYNAPVEGILSVNVTVNSTTIPSDFHAQSLPVGSISVQRFVERCTVLPEATKTIPNYIAHYRVKNDAEISATHVTRNGKQICENVEL